MNDSERYLFLLYRNLLLQDKRLSALQPQFMTKRLLVCSFHYCLQICCSSIVAVTFVSAGIFQYSNSLHQTVFNHKPVPSCRNEVFLRFEHMERHGVYTHAYVSGYLGAFLYCRPAIGLISAFNEHWAMIVNIPIERRPHLN